MVSDAPSDFPASVAPEGTTLYATNVAFMTASAGKQAATGLLRIAQ
jgi:hypothetical protein